MSVNFKYDKNGFLNANIVIEDSSDKGYDEFQSDCNTVFEHIFNGKQKMNTPKSKKKSHRTKGRAHYSVDDIDLVHRLIDAGYIGQLHGVNNDGKRRVYHFDKTEEVKQTIESYYASLKTDSKNSDTEEPAPDSEVCEVV